MYTFHAIEPAYKAHMCIRTTFHCILRRFPDVIVSLLQGLPGEEVQIKRRLSDGAESYTSPPSEIESARSDASQRNLSDLPVPLEVSCSLPGKCSK